MISKEQFRKIQRVVNKILNQKESDAISKGVDITSEAFGLVMEALKEELLKQHGLTLKQYNQYKPRIANK